MRIFLLLLIQGMIYINPSFIFAQGALTQPGDNNNNLPSWIKMIDDPNVNYYDAVKTYDEYWKTHIKPADEEEEMESGNEDFKEREREVKKEIKKEKDRVFTEEELKSMNENNLMKYQVKRFEQWKREVMPFVQEDGRILSDKERMEIWEKQQEEIRNQKK